MIGALIAWGLSRAARRIAYSPVHLNGAELALIERLMAGEPNATLRDLVQLVALAGRASA